MKKINIFKRTCILIVVIIHFETIVLAEQDDGRMLGQMGINEGTLTEDSDIDDMQLRPIGYEVAPFLFLEDMTFVELERAQMHEEGLNMMRRTLFLDESPETVLDTGEILTLLFQTETYQLQGNVLISGYSRYFKIPPWLFVIGAFGLVGSGIYFGVTIGKSFGHLMYRGKESD